MFQITQPISGSVGTFIMVYLSPVPLSVHRSFCTLSPPEVLETERQDRSGKASLSKDLKVVRGKPHRYLQKSIPGSKGKEPEAMSVLSTMGTAGSLCDWSRETHGKSHRT